MDDAPKGSLGANRQSAQHDRRHTYSPPPEDFSEAVKKTFRSFSLPQQSLAIDLALLTERNGGTRTAPIHSYMFTILIISALRHW
ncbi:hypothetical protein CVT25_002604 [Psilocybe cyanescens]|uniref:Uncharacterized protein n=1 Tax=Psilocybe cyanescens TaxID=93625 RepID=A0A409XWG7_PSICY|nr:hypothetical protein CVT25_002604 [Psilocybe cyanescens]